MREELAKIASDLRRTLAAEAEDPASAHHVIPKASPPTARTLARIAAEVRACTRCALARTRRNAVPGEGPPTSPVLFVGEAPGADEDRQGRPFVGRAGELLTRMLAAVGIERTEVFIANVLKCRPPRNRDPRPEEQIACRPYLDAQIEALRPAVICTLGRVPAQLLLETTTGILTLRGTPQLFRHRAGTSTLLPLLHPAYLLRNPRAKRDTWEDLKLLHRLLRERVGNWPPPLD